MRKSYFSIAFLLKRNSQAYNGVKNVSVSVVSLIVKFSHNVHKTCLDDFASEVLPVPHQRTAVLKQFQSSKCF